MKLSILRAAALALASLGAFTGVAHASGSSPYSTAPFTVGAHGYDFGQAPTFMPDGRIVVGKDFHQGDGMQVYRSGLDGSARKCLTCDLKAPNNVPVPRPQGDWILFHSWNGHHITFGSPGYGGIGSELWVMRPDGSHKTQITGTDAARGAGEGEDDYHAYWSPDGKQIVYAHLNWNFATDEGQGKWDIRVADFVEDGSKPPTSPTSAWSAPRTATGTRRSGGRLTGAASSTRRRRERRWTPSCSSAAHAEGLRRAAAHRHRVVERAGSLHPRREERDLHVEPRAAWLLNTFAELAKAAGLTTSANYLLTLPIFEAAYFQPVLQRRPTSTNSTSRPATCGA